MLRTESQRVSEPPDLNRQIAYQASHDALTGLLNRREFNHRLQAAIESAQANSRCHVFCYLDLDRFKAVNDDCGFIAGDSVLRDVATLIKNAARDSDTVGRLGSDEFGILLTDCPLEKARQIANDLARAVAEHRFVWKERIFNIGVSVGLVEISRESGSVEDVISAADSAMFVAKWPGRRMQVYTARDRDEIHSVQQLQIALRDGRFELHAQAIAPLDAASAGGPILEVLPRIKDENGVSVAPTELMRAAERYRLMPHVDCWLVQTALAAMGRGAVRLPQGRSLLVPLSGQSLGDPAFLGFVIDCLDRTAVAPDRICFAVTENSVITNIEHARRFMGVLHGLGCQFALDDFGRGLSSFANLKSLPLDYLRIDGNFNRDHAPDDVNQAMVTAMIKLAQSLNFRLIASPVDRSIPNEEIVAVAIDLEVGGEKVLGLEVHADGSVWRIGSGSPAVEDKTQCHGSSAVTLLSGILAGVDQELLGREGLTVLEPVRGKLCKLAIHFWRKNGGGNAFEVWYGSESTQPSPSITAFVENAIRRTDDYLAL
jgi:diguanylate cyclase (GGDEF)-like protein